MPLKGKFAVSIFNFLLFVALFNAQNLVIVFLLSSFGFLLRKLKFLLYLESCRVDASSRAVVVDRFFPVFKILVHFTALYQCLGVVWHHFEANIE